MRLLFLIFIIFIIIIIFFKLTNPEMTFIKSDIDKRYYMVRNLKDKQTASNILAYNREKILKLIKYLNDNKNTKYKDYRIYIDRLVDRVIDVNIVENNGVGRETSYSVNKGDELVLCLRSRTEINKLHDNNLLFYVILHELSHIASPVYEDEYNNHGPIFKKIFNFLTRVAIELNLYKKIDFNVNSKEYCGIYITDSIV
jgi:hypothetical protein